MMKSKRSKARLWSRAAVGLLVGWLVTEPCMAIEEPHYDVLMQDAGFAVRRYAPRVMAETQVDGSLWHSSYAGFQRIAGYIFGGNRSASGQPEKIAMTAPVAAQPSGTGWTIAFVMPSSLELANLPVPVDRSVKLKAVPAQTVAVLRFSGWADSAAFEDRRAELEAWMHVRHLRAVGPALLARYDPPWTLPFFRRNEIWIPCDMP